MIDRWPPKAGRNYNANKFLHQDQPALYVTLTA